MGLNTSRAEFLGGLRGRGRGASALVKTGANAAGHLVQRDFYFDESSSTINAVLGANLSDLALAASATIGGSSISGELNQSLGSLVLSSASVLPISGTLSAPLGAVGLSSSAALQIFGQLSQPLGSLVLSSASVLSISGVLSASLGAVGLSGAARNSISGQLSTVLGSVSGSASSGLLIGASHSGQLSSVALNAQGALVLLAQSAQSLGALSLSAQGASVQVTQGQLNASLGELTCSSAGNAQSSLESLVVAGRMRQYKKWRDEAEAKRKREEEEEKEREEKNELLSETIAVPVPNKPAKRYLSMAQLIGVQAANSMSLIDLKYEVQAIKRKKRQREEDEFLMMY